MSRRWTVMHCADTRLWLCVEEKHFQDLPIAAVDRED
jgi:hypothetical protein